MLPKYKAPAPKFSHRKMTHIIKLMKKLMDKIDKIIVE